MVRKHEIPQSTDKEHGKPGHICSTLCGASMIRGQEEKEKAIRGDAVPEKKG